MKNNNETEYFELDDGEIRIWIEQQACICIKAITKSGDPVEITGDQARDLAEILLKFSDKIDD